jgi:hypothetical protein
MIKIYDNVFSVNHAQNIFTFVRNAGYHVGWNDNDSFENAHRVCLHSGLDTKDVVKLGILEELKNHEVGGIVNLNNLFMFVVNLSFPGQTHIEHTHDKKDVLLYYASPVWKREWSGETLFYSEDGIGLERAIEYIPNRLVFFNGEHPHTIRPPSFEATFYRFTISLFFDRV